MRLTIAAGFAIGKHIILIGDILISGPEPSNGSYQIYNIFKNVKDGAISLSKTRDTLKFMPPPATTNEILTRKFSSSSQLTIIKLKQKICLLNDRVAIAWSGSYIGALTVINELMEQASLKPLTLAFLLSYFDKLDKTIGQLEVSFIIAIFAPTTNKSYLIPYKATTYESEIFGKVFIIGIGKTEFLSLFKKAEPKLNKEILKGGVGILNIATAITSPLLSLDFMGRGLTSYFGGGYEIAYLADGKIQKADNVHYIYWHTQYMSNGNISLPIPFQIHSYKYLHDLLSIRTIRADRIEDRDGKMKFVHSRPFTIIPPINRNVNFKEVQRLLTTDFPSILDIFGPHYLSGFFANLIFLSKDDQIYYIHFSSNDSPIHFKPISAAPDDSSSSFILSTDKSFINKYRNFMTKFQ